MPKKGRSGNPKKRGPSGRVSEAPRRPRARLQARLTGDVTLEELIGLEAELEAVWGHLDD